MKWFAPERLVLVAVLLIGLWLGAGNGIVGFLVVLAVCTALGGVMGLVGNRYPMIYRQNRRDRRRRSSSWTNRDDTTGVF